MKELNKLRLAAGITIDPSIEITEKVQVKEAREAPRRKADLKQTDGKSLKAKMRGLTQAVKHVKAAVESLERIPATDFSGDVPRFIGELEDLLDAGGSSGMEAYLEMITSELRKLDGTAKKEKRKEEEEERYVELEASQAEANDGKENCSNCGDPFNSKGECTNCGDLSKEDVDEDIGNFLKNLSTIQRDQLKVAMDALKAMTTGAVIGESEYNTVSDIVGDRIEEAMHYYDVQYDGSHTANGDKPINVVDGSSNDEQVMDSIEPTKNESPNQLKTMDQQDNSKQDKSGDDLNSEIKVPNGIKQSLKTEIEKARKEATRLDTRDKDASYFYKDLAKAFEDLLGHIEKGTRYDIKQAQIFAQTLMGPMLHKIPTDVWKYLTNGGETRSLKSYMTDVSKKYPITGPRNTLK